MHAHVTVSTLNLDQCHKLIIEAYGQVGVTISNWSLNTIIRSSHTILSYCSFGPLHL